MRRGLLLSLAISAAAAACLASAEVRAQGVTLFRDRDLSGPSQTFYDDVPDLKYTQFGSRRASSIAVTPGCVAILYESSRYRGRSTVFRDDDNNLRNTSVGEDTVSSMRVTCRGRHPGRRQEPEPDRERPRHGGEGEGWGHWESGQRGAILYRDRDGEGPRAFFDRDVPDLDRTRFGSRTASSVDVSPGCRLTLYERPDYRGRQTEFRERDNNLKNTPVGEDAASSLRIRCE